VEEKAILEICKKYKILYENRVLRNLGSDLEYPDRAMLHSEVLLFCAMIEFYKIQAIMIVGDEKWYLARIFSLFFEDGKRIIHIGKTPKEKLSLSPFKNVMTFVGRPSIILRDYLQIFKGIKLAILFETPKAESALVYVQDCLLVPNVRIIGIYGCPAGCRSRKLYNRLDIIYSDAKKLVEEFRYMDGDVWKSRKILDNAKYVPYGKEIYDVDGKHIRDLHYHSYGATLGLIFNPLERSV